MALLAALVLLALSAAMATVAFSGAYAMRRAALTTRARACVETGVRRAFAQVLAGWNVTLDTLPVGTGVRVVLNDEPAIAGLALVQVARVERSADRIYTITVDVRAFAQDHPLARRRARLWLQRAAAPQADGVSSGALVPPSLVTPWGVVDLY